MGPVTREAFFALMPMISAREQLQLQATLGTLFDERRREFQMALAETAFADDDAVRAAAIEAITRK
jgi:hypothetical protein